MEINYQLEPFFHWLSMAQILVVVDVLRDLIYSSRVAAVNSGYIHVHFYGRLTIDMYVTAVNRGNPVQ